ncbi:hypothetical protein [Croceimicrobium sp.]|uniref:hypothetical protein n=1 Tax=Croceimicrobium sp. TaxID=2828340 RepID=UPI003BAC9300
MRLFQSFFGYLFLGLLLLQSFGIYPSFRYLQQQIRQEVKSRIKAGIPEEELIAFRWNSIKEQAQWTKAGKEFRYRGEMFDIIRIEGSDSDLLFYCFADLKEKGLFDGLNDLVRASGFGDKQQPGPLKSCLQWFFKIFLSEQPTDFKLSIQQQSFQAQSFYLSFLGEAFLKLLDPPPEA